MPTNRDNDSADSPAPPLLIAALRQTHSAHVFVPRTRDEAVLRAARAHLAPAKPQGSNPITRWLRWPTVATACLLLCAVAYRLTRTPSSPNPATTYVREDLNRDGRVDILDAFQLAREVQASARSTRAPDLNSDGIVDRRDAEIIAAQAVKLEKGGRS